MNVGPQAPARLVYEFGPFVLDPNDKTRGRLVKDNQDWPVQNKVFDLLSVLVVNHGKVISCDQLIREVWEEEPDPTDPIQRDSNSRKIYTTIARLRNAIGETRETEIHNKQGGYVFLGTVHSKPSRRVEHESFTFSWIFRSPECRKTKILFIAGAAISLGYLIQYLLKELLIPKYGPWPDPRLVLSVIQFLVVGGGLIASFAILDPRERAFPSSQDKVKKLMKLCGYDNLKDWRIAKRSAKKSLRLYFRYWKLLLGAWTLLWFIMIGKFIDVAWLAQSFNISAGVETLGYGIKIVSTTFNNCNSAAIALCYIVLNHPTVSSSNVSNTNLIRLSTGIEKWGGLGIILFIVVELLFLFTTSNEWLSIYLKRFDVASGLIGGICLALFVGRIQSKLLGSSAWLPAVLYSYVAIQSLYMAIPDSEWGGALLITAALLLKCLMFLYVVWLVKSGRFLFYFVRVRAIYDKANPEWREFLLNLGRKK